MKSEIISALAFVIILAACNKNGTTLTPAQTIQGSYTAYKYLRIDSVKDYPINGKTITMQIDAIGEDSVRLQLRSVQNGLFSPGDTVIDRHMFVQRDLTVCWVTLINPVDSFSAGSSIRFEGTYDHFNGVYIGKGYYGYYVYAPPGYTMGGVETLFKKTQ